MNKIQTRYLKSLLPIIFLYGTTMASATAEAGIDDEISIKWKAKVTAGLLNDSNVAIDELDQDSTEGDSGLTWSAKFGPKIEFNDRLSFRASAGVSNKSYEEFDQFDLSTTLLSAQTAYEFTSFKLGVGIRDISTDLDSVKFLSNQQYYVFATHRPNRKWFLRGELNSAEKEFELQPIRNTSKESIGLDVYYFLDSTRKFWTFGFKYEDENSDSNSDEFGRKNIRLKARYSQTSEVLGRDVKFEGQLRYQARDYNAIDPRIGEIRDDDRLKLKLSAEIPISRGWYVLGEYEYSDFSSNLATADYTQNLFVVKVGWEFD